MDENELEQQEQLVRTSNPRDDAIEEIAKKRVEQAAQEGKELPNYGIQDPLTIGQDQQEQEPEAELEAEDGPAPEEEKPQLVKIKVDGEEREVPLDQIIEAGKRTLQKETATEQRLIEATRLLREAEQRAKPQPSQDVASPQTPVVDSQILEAIRYGDDNQAAEALKQLTTQIAGLVPTATPNDIRAIVAREVSAQEALTRFKTEYKDVIEDPYLAKLAVQLENENLMRGDTRSDYERFQEIGNKLREWRGTTQSTGLEEKREKKASIHLVQPAAGRQPAKPVEKEPTASELIEEIRKSRKQATI
jgi:hypothetical protein